MTTDQAATILADADLTPTQQQAMLILASKSFALDSFKDAR